MEPDTARALCTALADEVESISRMSGDHNPIEWTGDRGQVGTAVHALYNRVERSTWWPAAMTSSAPLKRPGPVLVWVARHTYSVSTSFVKHSRDAWAQWIGPETLISQ